MNKTLTGFKRYLAAAVIFLLGVVLSLTIMRVPTTAFAAEDSGYFTEPDPVALSIANLQFADASSATPAAPSGWTGGGMDGLDSGSVVAGVVDLTASAYNKAIEEEDVYKLTSYPEYKSDIPRTPFGPASKFAGTNKNVLMINTADSETAYAYTSQAVSLSAGGYYRFSVYVKTGDFADGKGATVKLAGLPEDLYFRNINTVKDLEMQAGLPVLTEKNLYGFKQYTFYVAAPNHVSSTVTLSLQVGDKVTNDNEVYFNPAKGYAFFDNIVAERISANAFTTAVNDLSHVNNLTSEYRVKDFNADASYLTKGDLTHFYTDEPDSDPTDIGSFEGGLDGWSYITDVEGVTANGHVALAYDTNSSFSDDNEFGFTSRPISPIGNQEGASHIFTIASSKRAAVGYRSPSYTVMRNTYYRIGYWVNAQNISDGSGATFVVRGTNGINDDDNKLVSSSTGLYGDENEVMRYGWKHNWIYIKGSAIKDYDISFEMWLGQPNALSSGAAMFDEITVERISTEDYSTYSSGGLVITFDPSFEDTGMSNGKFFLVGNYEDYKYPLLPANWSKITPDTAETTGFSATPVKSTENVVSGIIDTDVEHFHANRANYNNVINPAPNTGNMLMISSLEDTAIAYRSPTVTVSSGSSYRLTASLKTLDVTGYGANLVLRSGSNVIATIEGIKNNSEGFTEYTFYLQGGTSDQTVSLEIWLGMNDRASNKTKLAAGTLFVNRVGFKAMGETENFADYAREYDTLRSSGIKTLTAAAYSFNNLDMTAYDYYDNSEVKTAYNWQLTRGNESDTVYGIFDATSLPMSGRSEIPDTFLNGKDAVNNGVLYLRNILPTYSAISTNNAVSLAENSYYRVSVALKVSVPQSLKDDANAVGAGIWLSGTDFKFENIKDTSTVEGDITDNETFKTFNFYVKTSSALDVWIAVSLGDSAYPNNACMGRVYVNEIKVTDIGSAAYESELANFDEDSENYAAYSKYNINVDLSTDEEELPDENPENPEDPENPDGEGKTDDGNGGLAWWLIPSILFAVAVLIAVIGTFIRRLLDKRSDKKQVNVIASYDRNNTLNKLHDAKEQNGGELPVMPTEDGYDEFDDTLSPAPATKKAARSGSEATDAYDEFDDSAENAESVSSEDPAETDHAEEPAEDSAETSPSEETTEADSAAASGEGEAAASECDETAATESESSEAVPETDEKAKAEVAKPAPKKESKAKPQKKAPKESKSNDVYSDDFED